MERAIIDIDCVGWMSDIKRLIKIRIVDDGAWDMIVFTCCLISTWCPPGMKFSGAGGRCTLGWEKEKSINHEEWHKNYPKQMNSRYTPIDILAVWNSSCYIKL